MIRKELKDEIESIANRLDVKDPAERAVKSILSALLGAIGFNQEMEMDAHVAPFTMRLLRAVARSMAGRN